VTINLDPASAAIPAREGSSGAIRIVLADDHPLMRRSLRVLLDNQENVEVVAEARDLSVVLGHVRDHRPDVLVLDLRMPPGLSFEAIRRLRAESPSTAIVVLTMEDGPAFARRALDSGAIGFVLKDFAEVELPEAIRRAAEGRQFVSPTIAARLDSPGRSSIDAEQSSRGPEAYGAAG
jgi:two-component system response regulator NreC